MDRVDGNSVDRFRFVVMSFNLHRTRQHCAFDAKNFAIDHHIVLRLAPLHPAPE
jgi:hypothetical protein